MLRGDNKENTLTAARSGLSVFFAEFLSLLFPVIPCLRVRFGGAGGGCRPPRDIWDHARFLLLVPPSCAWSQLSPEVPEIRDFSPLGHNLSLSLCRESCWALRR